MQAEKNRQNLIEVLQLLKTLAPSNDGTIDLDGHELTYYIHGSDFNSEPIEEWYFRLTFMGRTFSITKVKNWECTWDESPWFRKLYEGLKKKITAPSQIDIKELVINGKKYRLVKD